MPTPVPTEQDVSFLRRAIRLAMNGRGHVEPNPMVGCVLVKNGQTIGEGWHGQFGGPHAEPTALADCRAKGNDPAGATAYVTLEPCCHTNKKTPPCAPRLIEAKVARVVIGCLDPDPDVNGKGVAMLRAAGIRVDGPVLEGEAKQLIAPFLARVNLGRPYVTLKWAETADGKVAGPGGRRTPISGPQASKLVHLLRARSDAILVGHKTAAEDDPTLTARGVEHARPLVRAVLGSADVSLGGKLLATTDQGPVVLYLSTATVDAEPTQKSIAKITRFGVTVVPLPTDAPRRLSLDAALLDLHARGASHLLVEPGPTLARSFFDAGVVDRAWVFRSGRTLDDIVSYVPVRYRGRAAPDAPALPYPAIGETQVGPDVLTEYLNPQSQLFFAPVPSSDFVLATGTIQLAT